MDKKEPSLLDLLSKKAKLEEAKAPSEAAVAAPTEPTPQRASDNRLLIESLEVNNVWCYKHERIDFEEGITVIAGPNGSGKS